MDPTRFDNFSKRFSTRRQALATGVGLAAAGLLARTQLINAQDATPAATPVVPADPHANADTAQTDPEYLFVQPFDGGAWAPKPGENDVFVLTLTGAPAQTTYFSDRPERDAGLAPTQPFLDGLGFTPDNPPNAALVAQTEAGEQEVLIVELFDPIYDAGAASLTYEAKVLLDYDRRGLAALAQQQIDYELTESFGAGSLFIDDCWDSSNDGCYVTNRANGVTSYLGNVTSGNCWNADGKFGCNPCHSYASVCNDTYPECALSNGGCVDDIASCGTPGCSR